MTRLGNYFAELGEQWARVEQAWDQTHVGWRDSVAAEFENQEWAPIDAQVHRYLSTLGELIECIDEAVRETNLDI